MCEVEGELGGEGGGRGTTGKGTKSTRKFLEKLTAIRNQLLVAPEVSIFQREGGTGGYRGVERGRVGVPGGQGGGYRGVERGQGGRRQRCDTGATKTRGRNLP